MTKDEIFEIITSHARKVLPELESYGFKPDDQLKELGANSVDRAEITMMAMESLSLQVPRIEMAGVKDLSELVEILHGKLQSN